MAKYRLKDQELQKKLDGLTKGAFSKWLLEQADINGFGDGTTYGVKLGEAIELGVLVRPEAVEAILEYNPNAWNSFPEVMPPEDVLMRVETVGGDTFRGYFHTFPDGVGRWCCVCFTPRHMPLHETEKVKRYRPLGVSHERDQNSVASVPKRKARVIGPFLDHNQR